MKNEKNYRTKRSKWLWAALVLPAMLIALVLSSGPSVSAALDLDGVIDPGEYALEIPFQTQSDVASANLHVFEDSNFVYLAFEIDRGFVDNSYDDEGANGQSQHSTWAPNGYPHRFRDLAESDLQGIKLYNSCGELAVWATMDYLDGYGGLEQCGGYKVNGNPPEAAPLQIINGRIDLNSDNNIDDPESPDDNGSLFQFDIINGRVDVNGDGFIDFGGTLDDLGPNALTEGFAFGYYIVDGEFANDAAGTSLVTAAYFGVGLCDLDGTNHTVDLNADGDCDGLDDGNLSGVAIIDGYVDPAPVTDSPFFANPAFTVTTAGELQPPAGVPVDFDYVWPSGCGTIYDATPSGYDANMFSNESVRYFINAADWSTSNFDYQTSILDNLNRRNYCDGPDGLDDRGEGDCDGRGNDLLGNKDFVFGAESPSWLNDPPLVNDYEPVVAYADNWEYSVIYEMKIAQEVFNGQDESCTEDAFNPFFSQPLELHASPNKLGDSYFPVIFEYGDHPDNKQDGLPDYPVLQKTNGPYHKLFLDTTNDGLPNSENARPAIWLGPNVDAEEDGWQSVASDGDDNNDTFPTHSDPQKTDDEDGAFPYQTYLWSESNGGQIDLLFNSDVGTARTAWVMVFFDWNDDGGFTDADEKVINQQVSFTATGQTPQSIRYSFSIPAEYDPLRDLRYRVRLFDSTTEPPLIAPCCFGPVSNGEVEDYLIPWEQLPVTLGYFSAAREAGTTQFEWQTVAQVGTIGFNLYVQTVNGRELVNEEIISTDVIDAMSPQDYVYEVSGIEGDTFYIEDLSIDGEKDLHGPFKLGEASGARVTSDPIDWEAIRAEHAQEEAERKEQVVTASEAVLKSNRLDLQQATGRSDRAGHVVGSLPELAIELIVKEDGLYRVTAEDLLADGFDLSEQKLKDLALFNQGQAVPIHVEGLSKFTAGAYFEFYGEGLDTLYTDENVYTLRLDPDQALRVSEDKAKFGGQAEAYYMETVAGGEENLYVAQTPTGDPWVDTKSKVYPNQEKVNDFTLPVDNVVPGEGPVTLSVGLWGRGQANTHHLEVKFNDVQVREMWFDGTADASFSDEPLNPADLLSGNNTVSVIHHGDTGFPYWDLAYVDSYSLTYPRAFVARDGVLTFSAKGEAFTVTNLPSDNVSVYRVVDGVTARMRWVDIAGSGPYSASFAGAPEYATYLVVTEGKQLSLSPDNIREGRSNTNISEGQYDFVIISHENFVSGLQPLVDARIGQGLDVLVVDVRDVYAQYGHGIFGPQAIKNYIKHAAQYMGAEYFLLVGGDTYDYRGYLDNGSISFIPSIYKPVGAYGDLAPVDPVFVDLDEDGTPDHSLGRFIVRTSDELEDMINKTLAYETNVSSSGAYGKKALFATDNGGAFKQTSDVFAGTLNDWQVEEVHLDDYFADGLKGQDARDALMDNIAQGFALTTFIGHSSATGWTFDGLLKNADVQALANPGAPTVVSQWGCQNTYYVDPAYNTMAHHFLVTGDNGAAAVLGAAGFSKAPSELLLGDLLTPKLTTQGMTLGEAMVLAKQEMAAIPGIEAADHAGVLLGWTLLGDPTVKIYP